eukprot:scaffold8522_cov157-Ochromonas_danica.AAC.4
MFGRKRSGKVSPYLNDMRSIAISGHEDTIRDPALNQLYQERKVTFETELLHNVIRSSVTSGTGSAAVDFLEDILHEDGALLFIAFLLTFLGQFSILNINFT